MFDTRTSIIQAAEIVSAFVGHNSARPAELPELIASVHAALAKLGAPPPVEEPAPELKPPVSIRKSVTHDYLISLEDGRQYKSLKRHLGARGMGPDDYRAKWRLPADYPMVAPSYSARRSELSLAAGFGRKRAAKVMSHTALSPVAPPGPATLAPVVEPDAPPKRRGRSRKVM